MVDSERRRSIALTSIFVVAFLLLSGCQAIGSTNPTPSPDLPKPTETQSFPTDTQVSLNLSTITPSVDS